MRKVYHNKLFLQQSKINGQIPLTMSSVKLDLIHPEANERMINWFKRRNIFEKKAICEHMSTSLKYYSHWATEYRKPYRVNAEKIRQWAQLNTPHDVPTVKDLMHPEQGD